MSLSNLVKIATSRTYVISQGVKFEANATQAELFGDRFNCIWFEGAPSIIVTTSGKTILIKLSKGASKAEVEAKIISFVAGETK